jgi:glycosyltransferase involved in cell wall biosynthesis
MMASRRVRSVCFVAPQAYPVLSGDPSIKIVGGAEVQQSILARELVRRGYRVSMVTHDHGQGPEVVIDGVRVIASHRPGTGWPKLQSAWMYGSMWQAMRRADADLYYQQNAGFVTGITAAFARANSRLAIYCGAHDQDFLVNSPLIPSRRDRMFYRWGLSHMDFIAAQSPRQVESCRRELGLASEVVRSFYGHKGQPGDRHGVLMWVARVHPTKGAEQFVDLARMCPELSFRFVGGGEPAYYESIRERAAGLSNLEFTGFIPYRQVEPMFDGIAAVVSTSAFEGLPNTFLQAWSRGVPTVSFFDPDCQLEGRAVGIVVPNLEAMAQAVRRLKSDAPFWDQQSADSRRYFDQTFALNAVADQYEQLFERLADSPRGPLRLSA